MSNVRPGDRAVVVKARTPANLGIVCEVVVSCPLFPEAWDVESLGRPFHVHGFLGQADGTAMVAIVHDSCLRRLPRPDEMPEDTTVNDSQPVATT